MLNNIKIVGIFLTFVAYYSIKKMTYATIEH